MASVLRRGEIWRIEGARERLGLVISSDVYNGTDVPIVVVAEVVDEEELRDSPLAVSMGELVIMPDRVSSPMKKCSPTWSKSPTPTPCARWAEH